MTSTPESCMGGWCSVRQQCARHLQPTLLAEERLCPSWNHVEFRRLQRVEREANPDAEGVFQAAALGAA